MQLYLKQKVFAIREKFNFFDADQNLVYRAEGSFFALPKRYTLIQNERPVVEIERKIFTLLAEYKIFSPNDPTDPIRLKKKFSFKQNFDLFTPNGLYKIEGSLFGFSFSLIDTAGASVMSVQKKYLSWGDAYEIFIDEAKIDPALACGIIISFDDAVHSGNNNR
ncbi:MAG: LURP-one-related family protein [Clostridiales bacterium]|jgi:uncharacterized protein YxjI|nr:LURP-one-related family protein [Clostridiales bacterium]